MQGLDVREPRLIGAFRGEPGLENVQVRVGADYGVDTANVAGQIKRFEARVQTLVLELDAWLPIGQEPDAGQLAAVVDLCALAHAAWVRICEWEWPHSAPWGEQSRPAERSAAFYSLPPEAQLRLRGRGREGDAGRLETNGRCLSSIARRLSKSVAGHVRRWNGKPERHAAGDLGKGSSAVSVPRHYAEEHTL